MSSFEFEWPPLFIGGHYNSRYSYILTHICAGNDVCSYRLFFKTGDNESRTTTQIFWLVEIFKQYKKTTFLFCYTTVSPLNSLRLLSFFFVLRIFFTVLSKTSQQNLILIGVLSQIIKEMFRSNLTNWVPLTLC